MNFSSFPLILLAAGQSSRMGFPKGILQYKGKKLLEYQIRSFLTIGGEKIYLVAGPHYDTYQKIAKKFKNVQLIKNDAPEKGAFFSIQLALKYLDLSKGAFILPIDTPFPDPSVWKNLLRHFTHDRLAIIPQFQKKGGHPVLIANSFFSTLLGLSPLSEEGRLDYQIKKISIKNLLHLKVDDRKVLLNLNCPLDLLELSERGYSKKGQE